MDETNRARLMEQPDFHDIAALVRFAIRAGLIPRVNDGDSTSWPKTLHRDL